MIYFKFTLPSASNGNINWCRKSSYIATPYLETHFVEIYASGSTCIKGCVWRYGQSCSYGCSSVISTWSIHSYRVDRNVFVDSFTVQTIWQMAQSLGLVVNEDILTDTHFILQGRNGANVVITTITLSRNNRRLLDQTYESHWSVDMWWLSGQISATYILLRIKIFRWKSPRIQRRPGRYQTVQITL